MMVTPARNWARCQMNSTATDFRALLVGSLLLTPTVASAAQRDSAAAPAQAELEEEFRTAARAAAPLAGSIAGDTANFLASVQPFGPLDLVILKGS